jgi:GH18 family chitinase
MALSIMPSLKGIHMQRKVLLATGLILAFIMSSCMPSPAATQSTNLAPDKMVVGYFEQEAPAKGFFVSDILATKITHLNYAFANVSEDGKCVLGNPDADVERVYTASESVNGKDDSNATTAFHGNFNQLLELKARYPHLKTLISIGGYEWSGNFSNAALTDSSRQVFVSSCIDLFIKQYPGVFDGIDLDWELPVSGGLVKGVPEDKHNFTLLLSEFRRQLDALGNTEGKHYLLTMAAAGGPGQDQHYERDQITQYLDWINLMTYDLHGTWDSVTNFNAPLYQDTMDPGDSSLNVDAVVQDYLAAGIPASKLVLGVPFYGYDWVGVGYTGDGLYQLAFFPKKSRAISYNDIKSDYLPTYNRFWNEESQVPYLYNINTAEFVSYDDPQSIAAKAGYAKDQNLAGIMIWELSQGDSDMLDAIQTGFQTGGIPHLVPTRDPNAVIVPRPFSAQIHSVSGITIDGNLDDWSGDPTFILNDKSQLAYKLSSSSWAGPDDLSGQVWAGWDESGLYFAINVVDDVHVQTYADENLWHGDYVEWQFDTQLEKDRDRKSMNSDDYQIGVSAGDFGSVPPIAYAWFNGPDAAGVMDIQQAQVKTENGYILEVFFPIELLKGITLADKAVFGMNVSLSDADDASLGQKAMLSTSPTRTYADPTTFGAITLVK